MYTVIFIDTKGPAKLGTYADKGDCRRGWKTCNQGAAILGPDGALLECKTGTTSSAETKLKNYAEHLRRQGGTGAAVSAPEPSRAKVKVERVEVEVEEDDEREPEEDAEDEREPEEDAEDEVDEEPAPKPLPPPPRSVPKAVAYDFPAGPEDFGGEDYPAEGPQPIACPPRYVGGKCEDCGAPVPFPSDTCGSCDQRRQTPADPPPVADAPAIAAPRGAAPVTCATKGCDRAPGIARSDVRLTWCPFCGPCRVIIRQRGRYFPGGEDAVMEHLRAGTLPPPDAKRAALGAKGGRNSRASQKPTRPTAARRSVAAPKPRRGTSLAAGLETARACAEVVARLGGLGPARELAAVVEEHGGAEAVLVTLAAVAELGGMAA